MLIRAWFKRKLLTSLSLSLLITLVISKQALVIYLGNIFFIFALNCLLLSIRSILWAGFLYAPPSIRQVFYDNSLNTYFVTSHNLCSYFHTALYFSKFSKIWLNSQTLAPGMLRKSLYNFYIQSGRNRCFKIYGLLRACNKTDECNWINLIHICY